MRLADARGIIEQRERGVSNNDTPVTSLRANMHHCAAWTNARLPTALPHDTRGSLP